MDTLYTFWENGTHYKTESVNFLGLMNSATKMGCQCHDEVSLKNLGNCLLNGGGGNSK